jgi:hypothetical protein
MSSGRGTHDVGGLAAGPVEKTEHDYALWEKRVDAMMVLLSAKGYFTVDELRRGIESLGAEAYEKLSYYERWIASITNAMIARDVVSIDELGRKMAEVEARESGRI